MQPIFHSYPVKYIHHFLLIVHSLLNMTLLKAITKTCYFINTVTVHNIGFVTTELTKFHCFMQPLKMCSLAKDHRWPISSVGSFFLKKTNFGKYTYTRMIVKGFKAIN